MPRSESTRRNREGLPATSGLGVDMGRGDVRWRKLDVLYGQGCNRKSLQTKMVIKLTIDALLLTLTHTGAAPKAGPAG